MPPHPHPPRNPRDASGSLPTCPKCGRRIAAPDARCIYCSGAGWGIFRRLIALLSPHKRLVAAMVVLNAAGVAIGLLPPYLTKRIIDDVLMAGQSGAPAPDAGDGRVAILLAIAGTMIAIAVVKAFVNYASGLIAAKVGSSVVCGLREKLHDALLHIELKFFGGRNSGEYTGRIMNDTEDVQRFLVDGSRDLVIQLLTMVGIAAVLIGMNWRLALITFAPSPFLVWISNSFHKKIHSVFHDQGTGIARLNTSISETIGGIRTIKAFAFQDARRRVFGNSARNVADIRIDLTRRFLIFFDGTSALIDFAIALVWLAASWMIVGGSDLTIGDLTAFVGYSGMFFGPLRWLSNVVNHAVNAMVGAERIFFVLDAPREEDGPPGAVVLDHVEGAIEIDDVHFGYEPGKEVLSGLSLKIAPGETIGLVGRSGVGKSTLVNLICRFFRVDSGAIRVDGHNVNDLDLATYRRKIGMVLQETFLFNATIFENIACAKPGATEAEVVAAAKAASAHEFIMEKEDGYQTIVGEGGARLSGGERQRIAIARAILHNPPILILDEATSAVDTETERKIRDALARLCNGRTVIAIAHRLSTLRNADRLAVLDGGKVAELGSHAELAAAGGIYSRLVSAQNELNEIGSDAWNPA